MDLLSEDLVVAVVGSSVAMEYSKESQNYLKHLFSGDFCQRFSAVFQLFVDLVWYGEGILQKKKKCVHNLVTQIEKKLLCDKSDSSAIILFYYTSANHTLQMFQCPFRA